MLVERAARMEEGLAFIPRVAISTIITTSCAYGQASLCSQREGRQRERLGRDGRTVRRVALGHLHQGMCVDSLECCRRNQTLLHVLVR